MKKASAKRNNQALRPEYDLSKLKGGVRGKYYRKVTAELKAETAPRIGDATPPKLDDLIGLRR